MNINIKKYILEGDFSQAYKVLNTITYKDLEQILILIGFDEASLCAYSFAYFLIQKNETFDNHMLAVQVLIHPLCHIEGSYTCALHHINRAIELCPNDIGTKELLLFLNEVPEKVVNDDDAIIIAKEILEKEPDNKVALGVLSEKVK